MAFGMNVENARTLRQRFRDAVPVFREYFQTAEIIPGSPLDEYDCIIHKLIGYLQHGGGDLSDTQTAAYLTKELDDHFGIVPIDINVLASKICAWWRMRQTR